MKDSLTKPSINVKKKTNPLRKILRDTYYGTDNCN